MFFFILPLPILQNIDFCEIIMTRVKGLSFYMSLIFYFYILTVKYLLFPLSFVYSFVLIFTYVNYY